MLISRIPVSWVFEGKKVSGGVKGGNFAIAWGLWRRADFGVASMNDCAGFWRGVCTLNRQRQLPN